MCAGLAYDDDHDVDSDCGGGDVGCSLVLQF